VTVPPAEGSAHPESPPVVADGGSSTHGSGDQGIPLSSGGASGGGEQASHDNATSRDESCAICFEDPPLDPCRTTCSHIFCSACLLQAFKTDGMWNRGKCPLCRERISIYSTTMVATGEPLGVPEVTTIFGSAYLQGGSVGVASYHFDAPDDAYISYEKAPAEWKLDDGSPPPARKPFVSPHYDDTTRTFTGLRKSSHFLLPPTPPRLTDAPLQGRCCGPTQPSPATRAGSTAWSSPTTSPSSLGVSAPRDARGSPRAAAHRALPGQRDETCPVSTE